ncbi:MAG: hypothetical protein K2X44_03045, partial [Magnetospirillum sp.]|nr:hypothetical protein [Magnetospirillum sp.]
MAWLIRAMLVLVLFVGPASQGQATQAPADFTSAMTEVLATNPGQAGQLAEAELRRINAIESDRRSGGVAAAHWVLAQAKFRTGDVEGAKQQIRLTAEFTPTGSAGTRLKAQTALLRGLIARSEGNFSSALQSYRSAHAGFISSRDARGQGLALQALGTLYVDVGDSSNGIQYLRFAEDAFTGDDLFNLSLENNYGAAYQGMERYADSEQHFVAALQIAERLNLRAYAIQIRLNLAMSAIFQNHLTAASSALAGLGPFKDLSETQQRELYRLRALMNLKAGHLIEAERLIELALEGADPQDSPFEFR